MDLHINIPIQLMGVFETPADYKLYSGHIVAFRRNYFSAEHGLSHIQIFENDNSTEEKDVIGHVSGELGTVNNEYLDCELISEIIDCYTDVGSPHQCTISMMLLENTTHRVTGSKMVVRLCCRVEDIGFFVDILNSYKKTFELIVD